MAVVTRNEYGFVVEESGVLSIKKTTIVEEDGKFLVSTNHREVVEIDNPLYSEKLADIMNPTILAQQKTLQEKETEKVNMQSVINTLKNEKTAISDDMVTVNALKKQSDDELDAIKIELDAVKIELADLKAIEVVDVPEKDIETVIIEK